jgi:hypothetical protein
MQVCEAGHHSEQIPQQLLSTLQHSLGGTQKQLVLGTHGLHARALAAVASFPCADASNSNETSVVQCWLNIFTHALHAYDSGAVAAILPWFAEYCACCAASDYTCAVPDSLLRAKDDTSRCQNESLFLELLQRAQELRRVYVGPKHGDRDGTAEQEHHESWIPTDETIRNTCLTVSDVLAEWTEEERDVQCVIGVALCGQVKAALKCEIKMPALDHLAGSGAQFWAAGKENRRGAAGNQGAEKDLSNAAARDTALRDALCMLRAVQNAEHAGKSSRAKGLLSVCSQLEELIGGP